MEKRYFEFETAQSPPYLPSSSIVSSLFAVFSAICGVSVVIFFSIFLIEHRRQSTTTSDVVSSLDPSFTLKNTNYDAVDYFDLTATTPKYPFLEDYVGIVEPYMDMELHFYDDTFQSSDYSHAFTVCPVSGSGDCASGTRTSTLSESVNFECSPYETFTIAVQTNNTNGETSTTTGTLICLYVRREIRTMTSNDLNKFLEVQYLMNDVVQDVGQSMYGPSYYSAKSLQRIHLFNAGQRSSDHLHDGNGFLMQHIKLQVCHSQQYLVVLIFF